MVVSYKVNGDSFVRDAPRLLSDKQLANLGMAESYEPASDGKRFAVLLPAENPEPQDTRSHMTLVLNFFDEVRRRLATREK